MKKITVLCSLAFLVASCDKKSTTTTPTTTTTTSAGTPSASSTPSPAPGNVDGGLISLKMDLATTTAGYTVKVSTESAIASFFGATGSTGELIDGGSVSVNGFDLTKQSNNSYLRTITAGQTTSDLNFSSNDSKWVVGGAGAVPAFTYTNNVPFPDYTGAMPDAITRSSGLTVTFSGNVTDADSVILFVVKNNTSITRTFAGSATSGSISSSDLSGLPVVTDNSAILEVIPYRITVSSQGGRKYAFVKERAVVKMVNIQ